MTNDDHSALGEPTPRTSHPDGGRRNSPSGAIDAWSLAVGALGVVVSLAQLLVEVT
ncbi:hypothetical protein [Streptomyces sp. NPDC055642]